MKSSDIFRYGFLNLQRRQLRSWLTIIGIIIGIATIVVLVSVGEGVKKDIYDQMEAFGSNMIIVYPMSIEDLGSVGPSMGSAGKLFERDIDYIKKVPGIDDISKFIYGRVSLRFKDKELAGLVYPSSANIFEMFPDQYEIEEGRYIQEGESKVAFLMNDAANEMFGKDKVKVNSYLHIAGEKFRVVGIAKKIGASMSSTDDAAIYVPFDDKDLIMGDTIAEGEIGGIMISTVEGADVEEVAERIEEQLASAHRTTVEDADFSVMTSKTINEMMDTITGLLTGSLFLIGLISAVVGGIGIANTMFMGVIERTKEIGILKSLGAKSFQILAIFLVEAGLIGGVGGLIGLGIGMVVIGIIPYFGVIPYLSAEVAVGSVLFAILVGMVAGLIPARNAAKIPPIEALRYD
ncbi:ABC transporter permease [Candidatus Micrarchaeota archaeon]|nr:ABC transporter permease [Candidatus Micrarchaeota archaeon]